MDSTPVVIARFAVGVAWTRHRTLAGAGAPPDDLRRSRRVLLFAGAGAGAGAVAIALGEAVAGLTGA